MWKCNTDIFTLKTAPVHHAWTNAGERSSCVKKQLYVNEPRRSFKITEATWEKRFREFEILLGKNRQPLQRRAAVRPPSALHLKACISACLQPRPLSNWEHLAWKIPKKTTQGWWAARILHQTRCEQYSRNTATTCCCDQSQTDLGGGGSFSQFKHVFYVLWWLKYGFDNHCILFVYIFTVSQFWGLKL